MTFVYSPKQDQMIIKYEDNLFEKYLKIIEEYIPAFAKYDCVLNVGRIWRHGLCSNSSENKQYRLP